MRLGAPGYNVLGGILDSHRAGVVPSATRPTKAQADRPVLACRRADTEAARTAAAPHAAGKNSVGLIRDLARLAGLDIGEILHRHSTADAAIPTFAAKGKRSLDAGHGHAR